MTLFARKKCLSEGDWCGAADPSLVTNSFMGRAKFAKRPVPPASSSSGPPSASAAAYVEPANGTIAALPKQCSTGVSATQAISCGLASNLFYEYYQAERSGGGTTALSAWSSATKQYYDASCSPANGLITCSVSGTTDPNARVELTQAALGAYSPQRQASTRRTAISDPTAEACAQPLTGRAYAMTQTSTIEAQAGNPRQYLDLAWAGYMDGAVQSGERAATEGLAQL
jgi:hypothetical protein